MIIISAGGTGGHIAPGEAIAERFKQNGENVFLFTDDRGLQNYKSKFADNSVRIHAYSFSRSKIKGLFFLALGVIEAMYHILRLRPRAIIGMGGYASAPTIIAGIILRRHVFLHEQNAVLGKVNRILASSVKTVFLSYRETKKVKANVNAVYTGMPVRKSVIDLKDHEYDLSGKIHILVTGGSQGAAIFGKYVPKALAMLPETIKNNIKVTHQIRIEDINPTVSVYQNAKIPYDVSAFFNNMPERMAKSHIIISRGGSSTINEAMVLGIPMIIVPLKIAADNHQTYNARIVADNGAGWVISEDDFNEYTLTKRLNEIISDKDLLRRTNVMAKKLGNLDALENIIKNITDNLK